MMIITEYQPAAACGTIAASHFWCAHLLSLFPACMQSRQTSFGVRTPLDSTLKFETRLRKVESLSVVRRVGKLFDYPRVPRSCVNAYVLSSMEYGAPCGCRLRSVILVC